MGGWQLPTTSGSVSNKLHSGGTLVAMRRGLVMRMEWEMKRQILLIVADCPARDLFFRAEDGSSFFAQWTPVDSVD